MAAALRRWAAGIMRKPQPSHPFPPSTYTYPKMLEKVEKIKVAAPTEDTAKVLAGTENRLKIYHAVWEVNERHVQGLLRHGLKCRAQVALVTVFSAACLAKGAHLAYEFIAA